MKRFIKILLILIIICFNINVFATEEDNTIEVKTEIENKDEETKKSSDATLKEVFINGVKVVCTDNVCELIIKDNSIDKVEITYKTNDAKAKVSKESINESLKEGENNFEVLVTAEDGTEKTYTFKITKKVLSTDSSLKKLTINGNEITLKANTLKYKTTVSYATKKLEIEAITNNKEAILVDGKDGKISYDFFDETSEIKLKVQAEAGDMSTYVITVERREEADATLKSLKITNASIDFQSGVFDYEIKVLRNVNKLEITATPNDLDADIKITNPDNLEIGENIVKVEVTNDGNLKTYTIKVTKLDEEDTKLANLSSLKIEGYDLNFKEDVYEYDLKIGDVNFLKIEAIPKVEGLKPEITGNLDLVNGSIIKIKVYYDDETYAVYKINIEKDEIVEKNNNLGLIIIIVVGSLFLTLAIVLTIIFIKKKNGKNKKQKNKKQVGNIPEVKKEDVISITSDEEIEDII